MLVNFVEACVMDAWTSVMDCDAFIGCVKCFEVVYLP